MNKHWKFKTATGLGAGLLLLGAAWLAQAAITIIRADGAVCTEGTINVSGAVTPVDSSCSGGTPGTFTLTVSKGTSTGTGTVTSIPAGIDCGPSCSASFADGASVTLTAAPGAGSTFGGWSGGGCTGTGDCTLTLTASTTVTANFTAPTIPTLTVVKAGTGSGTITGTGISCGTGGTGDCTELYGSPILLTATPGAGSTFAGWSGGGCSGTATTCTPTLTSSGTVTATFNGSCSTPPAAGRVVSIVDTGTITSNWAQRTFAPLPSTITAFKVTVPSGFGRRGDIVAIKSASTARAPMMILSTQPGCADMFSGGAYCKVSALDGAKIKMSGNLADTIYYCKLPPGEYYVNAFNQATVGGAYTCTTTTNCTFFASRSANY